MVMTMVIFCLQAGRQIMHTVKASEFKAKCLQLMEEVNRTQQEIIITKNGKPVSRLVPYRKQVATLFGLHKGQLSSHDDLIEPDQSAWDAAT
jgi:prevent-host-death family protein